LVFALAVAPSAARLRKAALRVVATTWHVDIAGRRIPWSDVASIDVPAGELALHVETTSGETVRVPLTQGKVSFEDAEWVAACLRHARENAPTELGTAVDVPTELAEARQVAKSRPREKSAT
jgi:hypothetical protein